MMTTFNRLEFVESLRPVAPFRDWRVYSLLVPAAFSAVGFFVFAVLGYSFTEFATIPAGVRFWLVVTGGICLAMGGEVGTLTSTVEVYRKQKLGTTNHWDWFALAISLVTTLASFVLAFAALLGARAGWSRPVQIWGAIVLGLLAALDAYGLFLETGFLFADYEQRMEAWFARMEQEQGRVVQVTPELQQAYTELRSELQSYRDELQSFKAQLEYDHLPVATLDDFRRIVRGLNGKQTGLVGLPARELVIEVCRLGGYRPSPTMSASTFGNWAKELK
jgi:hypothetical protein